MPGFSGFTVPGWLRDAFDQGLRSVCVYGENVRNEAQIRRLGAELREACPDALLAIDEEGGEVTRLFYLSGSPYPGAALLGRIDDPAYTEQIGERIGRELLAAGFDLALGPVADVNSNPANPVIGTRSFGASPDLASRHVAAWTRGLQRTSAHACAKHFPGHGDTEQDSHLALPTVDVPLSTLRERELPPFRAAIEAGVSAVMTSHILMPQVDASGPATFSRPILQGLLRDELDFDGLIVSDALDMRGASGEVGIPKAAVRALIAGCDLLCLGTNTGPELLAEIEATVLRAIDEGRLTERRLAEAAGRVRALTSHRIPAQPISQSASGAEPGPGPGPAAHAPGPDAPAPRPGLDAPVAIPTAPAPTAPSHSPASPTLTELDRAVEAFEGIDAARAWIAAHPDATIVRIDSEANMAVGDAPWGPFAAAMAPFHGMAEQAQHFSARVRPAAEVAEDLAAAAGTAPLPHSVTAVILIGRGLRSLSGAQRLLTALRAARAPVLVVEMGWPGPAASATEAGSTIETGSAIETDGATETDATADAAAAATHDDAGSAATELRCYGSSRFVGAALLRLIGGAAA